MVAQMELLEGALQASTAFFSRAFVHLQELGEIFGSFFLEILLLSGHRLQIAGLLPAFKLGTLLDKVHAASGIPRNELWLVAGSGAWSYRDRARTLGELGLHAGAQLTAVRSPPSHERLRVGELVEYWSEVRQEWTDAVVLAVHMSGEVYDLDCERRASWRCISRPRGSGGRVLLGAAR